jgi:PadR family transcriptional regulator, regulatory protein PadR
VIQCIMDIDILTFIQYNAINGDRMNLDGRIDNLILELRRGVIVLGVLSQLDEERYGYALINRLKEKGLEVDQGTLYPLLRRLESQGLLESNWRIEADRPRRYYILSPKGRELLPRLRTEWAEIVSVMSKMTK